MPHVKSVVCAAIVCLLFLFIMTAHAAESAADPAAKAAPASQPQSAEQEQTFEITEFKLEGNSIFPTQRLLDLVDDLVGPGRTAADVEKARDLLEQFYHEEGYPTVMVNIPEQKVEEGVIRLQVIESRIGACKVTGNRYFTTEQITRKLPSLAPGVVLYVPDVQKEVNKVNRNPDLKAIPSMTPGTVPGTVDVALKCEDHRPFHGSLELSDRNSPGTTPLRLNAALHYDNLWNREHAISFQYQTAPDKPSEVQVFSGSYTLPAPWNEDHSLVVYGVSSDSDTAFGEGFHTVGKGSIIGLRYIMPLPGRGDYGHTAVAGFDYKKFNETTGLVASSDSDVTTPVEYFPFTFAYSGFLPDDTGMTLLNATLSASFRGMVAREGNFADNRFKAHGNYLVFTLGTERRQKLPAGMGLGLKLDGQIADQPLIPNEQFSAGGMESVRGYRESEALADSAFHAVAEFSAPDLAPVFGLGERYQLTPYLFYDCALLWTMDPLPGQDKLADLQGTGIGIRGFLFKDLEFQLDWAFALADSAHASIGDSRGYFRVKYQF